MRLRVLVLDGDKTYRDALCAYLDRGGVEAMGIDSGATLDAALAKGPFDAVLCSVDLPGESGFSVAARLRLISQSGLVLLTDSVKREEKMLALSLGVDHYLERPDDLREIEMLVRNLHRRLRGDAAESGSSPSESSGHWVFDTARWTLITPDAKHVSLSLAEYIALVALMTRAGEVISREELLAALDRRDVRLYSRNLDMIISRLRRKVARCSQDRLPILSARGIGYVFTGAGKLLGEPPASISAASS